MDTSPLSKIKSKTVKGSPQKPVLYGESTVEQQRAVARWAEDVIEESGLEGYVYLQTRTTIVVGADATEVTHAGMLLKGVVPLRLEGAYIAASKKLANSVRDIDMNVKLELCEGDIAPELDLYNLEGAKERLFGCARRHNRTLVVLFWSADSGASILPLIDLEAYTREGVCCVAVSLDSSMKATRELVSALSRQCEYLWCGAEGWSSKASREWGVHSTPMCYVIDSTRKVVCSGHPMLQADSIKRALDMAPGPEDDNGAEDGPTWTNLGMERQEEFLVNFQSTLRALPTTQGLRLEVQALTNHHKSKLDATSFVLRNADTCSKEELGVVDTHLQRLVAELEQVDYAKQSY